MSAPGRRDVVVCIPERLRAAVEAEEREVASRVAAGETDITYYWTMRIPRCWVEDPATLPRRIYFVWQGAIRAFHEVVGAATDRVIMSHQIHEVEAVPMRPFRGWRYMRHQS